MWVLCYSIMYTRCSPNLLSSTPELLPPTPFSPIPLPKETWDVGRLFINDWQTLKPDTHFAAISIHMGQDWERDVVENQLNSWYETCFSALSTNSGNLALVTFR